VSAGVGLSDEYHSNTHTLTHTSLLIQSDFDQHEFKISLKLDEKDVDVILYTVIFLRKRSITDGSFSVTAIPSDYVRQMFERESSLCFILE
jgi:hypothetical protein